MHVELTKLLAHLVYIARRPNVTLYNLCCDVVNCSL